ncbi:transposase [Actinomyces sp. oral taxon 171]|uniref:transposase n=2 Tax=Actinomyces sp. oral taxon 171 TaxID=706438 RepID=UPI001CEC271C
MRVSGPSRVCSLPMEQAQPEQVATWVQGHWGIEKQLHWIRDVIFDADRHQLRTRNGPEIIAALRNLTTRPHPPLPHHQIPIKTTHTSHQTTHPTNPLNRVYRPLVEDGVSFSCFYYTRKGKVGNAAIRLFLAHVASGDEHR